MQRHCHEEQKRQATEEASLWLERLERTLKDDEGPCFREWLKAPLHREIIVERCVSWHGDEILAVLGALIPDDVALRHLPSRPRHIESVLAWVLAICVVGLSTALLLGGPPWTVVKKTRKSVRVQETYRTPLGGRQEVNLPDGGKITMNTATSVFVHYGPRTRSASLLRGEAMFDATTDPSLSFQLHVGARVIETEGARFNVRRLTTELSEITVLDGEVTLSYPWISTPKTAAQRRDSLTYSYGKATVPAAHGGVFASGWQSIAKVTSSDTQARLAWLRNLIIFTNESLEDALAEATRYVDREFVFVDQNLRKLRMSGEFRTGDIGSIRRELRNELRIESRIDERGRIVLARLSKL